MHLPRSSLQPHVPLMPRPRGFAASLKHCFKTLPTLEMATSNAEEPKMASRVIGTDSSYLPSTGLSSQAFLIETLKESLVTKLISWRNALPTYEPRLTESQGNQYALGLQITNTVLVFQG